MENLLSNAVEEMAREEEMDILLQDASKTFIVDASAGLFSALLLEGFSVSSFSSSYILSQKKKKSLEE